jgi:hypothetical protein
MSNPAQHAARSGYFLSSQGTKPGRSSGGSSDGGCLYSVIIAIIVTAIAMTLDYFL